jgi:hypothetical protein
LAPLISREDDNITIAILHFGISHDNNAMPILNVSPQSPPTVVYGKHAIALSTLLERDGIPVFVVHNPRNIQIAATRKLVWSSLMWLLCHDSSSSSGSSSGGGNPISVKEVHQFKSNQLRSLVDEILPSLCTLALESWTGNNIYTSVSDDKEYPECEDDDDDRPPVIGSVQNILDYLLQYSMSMSNGCVIPSLELALNEIQERNGLLLSLASNNNNKQMSGNHINLIHQVAGNKILQQCLKDKDTTSQENSSSVYRLKRIKCISSNLEFLFNSNDLVLSNDHSTAKSAIVVGAGMIGSSIAYHMSCVV